MSWTANIIQHLFKTGKPEDTLQIVDGKIIDSNLIDLHADIKQPDNGNGDKSAEIEFANLIHPEPDIEITGLPPNAFPLAVTDYSPMYLTGTDQELFMFLNWLEMKARKPQTIHAYANGLRQWREELNKHFRNRPFDIFSHDFEHAVKMILKRNAGSPGFKLFKALSSYAKYRNDYGDPRLMCIFAVADIKTTPALGKGKQAKLSDMILTPERIKMLNARAKELVVEGDRAGLWLGLALRGIPVSAIYDLEFITQTRIRFRKWKEIKEVTIPEWLANGLRDISETKWRLSRGNITRKITKYEHPVVVLKNHSLIMSVLRI
jgi:hypothetical protein